MGSCARCPLPPREREGPTRQRGRVKVLPRNSAASSSVPSPARFRGHPLPGRERD
ncbi:hypothetical protein [Azospirillum argentinense]